MAKKKVTRIANDTRPGVAETYEVKGYSAKACQLDAQAIELGYKPEFHLNVFVVAGESLLEAVLPFGKSHVYLALTSKHDTDDVARMRDKPQALADYAAIRVGPAVRTFIDAIAMRL
ncbi:hypothetical protein ELH70_14570 [Rhizobium ruizarguesonis]|uniref:hypothetical protein n=1 Tax=Rhizobium ruizarguesonis TaxID=2081791 RepID=UPI00102FF0A1|nr:hypothetical protein [Rhizobium ruizarguesonis]TAZ73795.1 hypothetical protein ELH70_14570 [Rhizobium ruizarguesonis]TAZ86777.1 hypothetical protein ELH69_37810 [Rhizobium ruizarguesonis]